jgi:hypothetical protein
MLDSLNKFDAQTANTILTAAAFSTAPIPGVGDDEEELARYKSEVANVLAEIRAILNLKEWDNSPKARASIDSFLSSAFDQSIFQGSSAEAALSRAGYAGRLSPGAYKVVQPQGFTGQFYSLAVTKHQVKEAVNQPDDYQHLMIENALPGEDDLLSIFMKRSNSPKYEANWLLISCVRRGIEQVAQSAWRVYPEDVDLNAAKNPTDVLAAFAEVFGFFVQAGGRKAKFIENVLVPKNPVSGGAQFTVQAEIVPPGSPSIASWTTRQTSSLNSMNVGLVYCIDVAKYRASLIRHGASVK